MIRRATITSIRPRSSARSALCQSIAGLAFAHWVRDGRPAGSALQYWLAAEVRILAEHAALLGETGRRRSSVRGGCGE